MLKRRVGDRSTRPAALWAGRRARHHARAVPGVLQADQPRHRAAAGLDAQPRGRPHRVHAAAVHPGARRRSTCGTATRRAGVKLYVKRVFIMDEAEALLPAYLRFVKGVIDCADLPLNVSRELLQESRDVKAIREGSTKRVLSMLEDLAEGEKGREGRSTRQVLEGVRRGAEGRHGRGLRQPRAAGQAAALRVHRSDERGRVAGRLQGAHEGRPGGDLLHHRRHAGRGEEQPAARDLPQEGHRGAAADRPRRRVGC